MTSSGFTLKKDERLYLKKQIGALFEDGKAFLAHPLRVQYLWVDDDGGAPVAVLFSVPKKRFKRAVKRNLLRRRMREAYRLNKVRLQAQVPEGRKLLLALVYIDKVVLPYSQIEKGLLKALDKAAATLSKNEIPRE